MKVINYFKALADETRLRLLNLLNQHELNVNEIVAVLNMGQSRISRHLKILTDNNLLISRHDGLWTFYSASSSQNGSEFISAIQYLFKREDIFGTDLNRAREIIERRSKETTRFFDSIAEDWETLKAEIIGDFDLNGFILDHIPSSDTAVDLGCGTGDLLADLQGKTSLVIGVDKSPNMLERARKRFSRHKSNIDIRIGEIEHLPLGDGEADLAIINMVLHHLASPQTAFREINRILASNTRFIIVDFLKHNLENMRLKYGDRWLGFSEKKIKKWLKESGFRVDKLEYFQLNKGLRGFLLCSQKEDIPAPHHPGPG
jgi:ArsR family transcriptional regulator